LQKFFFLGGGPPKKTHLVQKINGKTCSGSVTIMHSFIYLINADPFGSVVKQSGNFIFAMPAKVVGGGLEGWRGSFFLSLENRSILAAFLICTGINYNFIMGPDPETSFH
jgi:hypothetical protein